MVTLTLVDVSGIQSFIFGSNRLTENVGASELVRAILDDWLKELTTREFFPCKLLFSGGGKALVQSSELAHALALMQALSDRVIEKAPGLTLFCAHLEWEEARQSFADIYASLHSALRQNKDAHWPEPEFDGFGVVASAYPDDSPAIGYDRRSGWRSRPSEAKDGARRLAEERLQRLFPLPAGYQWTNETDKLGRSRGERSLVGIIHFDGNGMGKQFEKASRTSLQQLTELSQKVKEAGEETLQSGLQWVADRLPILDEELDLNGHFPVRPILFGGDDITLLCEGRIALDLAVELLRAWEKSTTWGRESGETACVGVALVPVRFPFFRAYEISEACCKRAKRWLRDKEPMSAIDWHLQVGGGIEELPAETDAFSCKPYVLATSTGQPYREWVWFREQLLHPWSNLKQQDEDQRQRTQLKTFGEALRAGATSTQNFLSRTKSLFSWSIPEPPGRPSIDGFFDSHTPYLDALEMMDRVIPQLPVKEKATSR